MSRIGKMEIEIPKGVEVTVVEDRTVSVKGPKGTLEHVIPEGIDPVLEDGKIYFTRQNDGLKAIHGLTRSLVNNMIQGVTEGFQKTLIIQGVGYRANKDGNKLVLNVGYSHPVVMIPYEGIEIEVPEPTRIIIKGSDKQKVGEFAANVRKVREPSVYKTDRGNKGIIYEGEVVRSKAGKTGAATK
ncbi:MAG TPA: 50S ribosomal protein L6 [Firmicutes bacterium]|nr:50S ribosomal protein L6 [Bacillota bacterium]